MDARARERGESQQARLDDLTLASERQTTFRSFSNCPCFSLQLCQPATPVISRKEEKKFLSLMQLKVCKIFGENGKKRRWAAAAAAAATFFLLKY